ncbi:hypothetical protein EVAR_16656_1 [Eumeta japonica]|uniref:Uncharacterized protein n=1 Tax=Eumeta variegata TaxID=151549 RepID=A0A4C1UZI5_EUMVA|nr:hypothetical protein EVAR_16656_1 [Eumeta japonica]
MYDDALIVRRWALSVEQRWPKNHSEKKKEQITKDLREINRFELSENAARAAAGERRAPLGGGDFRLVHCLIENFCSKRAADFRPLGFLLNDLTEARSESFGKDIPKNVFIILMSEPKKTARKDGKNSIPNKKNNTAGLLLVRRVIDGSLKYDDLTQTA